jgi:NAD(P)-dependent dehydrogenase (short-subunit alcohol dehydrogenase family)
MGASWSQFFPLVPPLTEKNLLSQKGKVFIVTVGFLGIGFELTKILFNAGVKVYIAGHLKDAVKKAIEEIKAASTTTSDELKFLFLDLGDLPTIKPAVDYFIAYEKRLDVLWNNAGVRLVKGKTKQGFEATVGINCVGPFLLTQLILPILEATAANTAASQGSTRVVWTSSNVVEKAPKGGTNLEDLVTPPEDPHVRTPNPHLITSIQN